MKAIALWIRSVTTTVVTVVCLELSRIVCRSWAADELNCSHASTVLDMMTRIFLRLLAERAANMRVDKIDEEMTRIMQGKRYSRRKEL